MSDITSQVQPTPSGSSNDITDQAPARPAGHPDYPPGASRYQNNAACVCGPASC